MEFKKKIALTFAVMGAGIYVSNAQTGIGTNNPDNSAQLDIYSNKRGVLLPRLQLVKTTEAGPVTGPVASLLIYNTATINDVTPGFYYWDGTKWLRIARSDESTFANLTPDEKASLKGDPGEQGPKGQDGTSVTIKGSKSDQDALPDTGNVVGDGYIIDGNLWVWDGITFNNVGPIQGPKGDKGDAGAAPTIGAGNITGKNLIAVSDGAENAFKNTDISLTAGTDKQVLQTVGTTPTWVNASSIGDNLGNHTATQDLTMSGRNINGALNVNASGTVTGANLAATTKVTTPAAQIITGAGAGKVAVSDTDGNVVWTDPATIATSKTAEITLVHESYAVLPADYTIIASKLSGDITITLPDAAANKGRILLISQTDVVNDAGNEVTVKFNVPVVYSDTMSKSELFAPFYSATGGTLKIALQSDNTNWHVVSSL